MKQRNKLMTWFLLFAMVISMITPMQTKAEDGVSLPFDVTALQGKTIILHTNDTHGRIENGVDGSLGYSVLATVKETLTKAGAEVLLMDAGDTFHGKPIATIDQGKTIVELMNLLEYDAMVPGNHDFNYGSKRLLTLSKKANFPILAANVTKKEDGSFLLKENTVIEKNGVKYGIFGLATPETATKTNPKNVETLNFNAVIETAKKEVKALKKQGAQVIIALGHIGIDESSDPISATILKKVAGIDLFIDGHSHSSLSDVTAKNKSKSLLVSNSKYLNTIGAVLVNEDLSMQAFSLTPELLNAVGIQTTIAEGKTEKVLHSKMGAMIVNAQKVLSKELGQVIGKTKVRLDGEREIVRQTESNLGNLSADALAFATDADFVYLNGGGIRVSIEAGDITKGMIADVFPFGNTVITKKVTGKAIKEMLEFGVQYYPELSGGFPQTSGATFTIDVSQPAGKRIKDLKIGGKKIKLNQTYILASNDYLIAGGDGFTMIGDDVFKTLMEYGALDEIVIQYIQQNPDPKTFEIGRTKTIGVKTQENQAQQSAA